MRLISVMTTVATLTPPMTPDQRKMLTVVESRRVLQLMAGKSKTYLQLKGPPWTFMA
ncbi:hypothetical protein TrRE_jg657, partial [Triparma retinervis]